MLIILNFTFFEVQRAKISNYFPRVVATQFEREFRKTQSRRIHQNSYFGKRSMVDSEKAISSSPTKISLSR